MTYSQNKGVSEMSKKETASLDRRDFFRKVGLGAGVAATAGLGAATAQAAAPDRKPVKGSGYQETDHVKTYYKLARF
jgi:hypothetical protein